MTDTTTPKGSAQGDALPVADEQAQMAADFAQLAAERTAPENDSAPGAAAGNRDDGASKDDPGDTSGGAPGDDGAPATNTPSAATAGAAESIAAPQPAAAAGPVQEQLRTAEEKLRRATGQVSALSKLLNKERAASQGTGPQLSDKDRAEYERLSADYPDIVRLVDLAAKSHGGAAKAEPAAEVAATVQALAAHEAGRAQAEQLAAVNEAISFVEGQRPGWQAAVKTDQFKQFVAASAARNAMANSFSVQDTIDLYDLFLQHHGKRAAEPSAAAATPNRGATASSVAQIRQSRVADSEGIAGRATAVDLDADAGDFESAFNAAARDLARQRQFQR